jgi:anaerobic dimethyl sulfoxide reductase subunit B (iron-sulfur subunit)
MSTQYGFYIDTSRCIQCYTCEIACKQENNIKIGPRWRKVHTMWSGQFPDVKPVFISLSCMHCGKPACAAVCPTGAITKRAEDGIVLVDQKKCIGCRYCFLVCPFGIPQFSDDGTMQKCNFCLDRLKQGKKPACVVHCPVKALHAGTMNELSKMAAEQSVRKLAGATYPSVIISK